MDLKVEAPTRWRFLWRPEMVWVLENRVGSVERWKIPHTRRCALNTTWSSLENWRWWRRCGITFKSKSEEAARRKISTGRRKEIHFNVFWNRPTSVDERRVTRQRPRSTGKDRTRQDRSCHTRTPLMLCSFYCRWRFGKKKGEAPKSIGQPHTSPLPC